MELLAQIALNLWSATKIAVPFIGVLSVVVFVHEFGHYIVGRWCGIKAEVFSIGFGKRLFGWTDRRGTHWQVAVLPLGGFVKFVGDMDPASAGRVDEESLSQEEQRVAFHSASLLSRTLAVAAGPFANFLLSVVIFAGMLFYVGQGSEEPVIGSIGVEAVEEVGLEPGDRVLSISGTDIAKFSEIINFLGRTNGVPQTAIVERDGDVREIVVLYHRDPVVTGVSPGMPAARVGMLAGDLILTIDGDPVSSYRQLQLMTAEKTPGAEIVVEIERAGERMTFNFVPEVVQREHPDTGEIVGLPTMGISGSVLAGIEPLREPLAIHRAISGGVDQTWRIISGTLIYIGDMLFKGADTSQLGGPIRIAEISGDAAEEGFFPLVYLIAVLSTSIGLINLFPIPILDGGHLMFYAVEFIRGRPVGEMWMRVGTVIGLSMVLLLMVFATYNDLVRL